MPQLDVFEAHIHDGLQSPNHVAVLCKQGSGLADGQVQHVGHVQVTCLGFAHGLTLDLDLQNLGAITLAIAIGAAQVHVRQKLHFNVFKTRSPASGAATISAIEAELAGRVAALTRQGRGGKNLAHRIPSAHIAGGVGSGGFTNGRLVHKHHIAQVVGTQQTVMCTGRFGGLAKMTHQSWGQHILNQTRLARAAHARDGDQALQRKIDVDVLQVVLACALQNQTRRAVGDHALETQAHLLAATQIGARQGVGMAQVCGAAIKHNLAAALTRPRAHVDHAVSGQHDRRVVLHHHQRVARIAQAVHGLGDAAHVTGVQTNAGLIQHKQGVDQRGAQSRGEVDALHLTAAQRAALAVECEVANAHITQVFESGSDLFEQQLQGLCFGVC